MPPLELSEIAAALSTHTPRQIHPCGRRQAAVACILRCGPSGPETLLIERARRADDPWSGHLAFPGGSLSDADDGPRDAAERETAEEVGILLGTPAANLLGRLADVDGSPLPMVISAFVYRLHEAPRLTLDPREVQHAFWFGLGGLIDPANQRTHASPRGRRPAVAVLPPGRPLLWGLTHGYLRRLLALVGAAPPG